MSNDKIKPVYYCNYDKENIENKKLFDRSFCNVNEKKEIIMDFKPNYNICQNYTTIDNYTHRDLNNKINTCNLDNVTNTCEPNKGNYLNYLKNIDIDSELKSMNRQNINCQEYKYTSNNIQNEPSTNLNIQYQAVPYNVTNNNINSNNSNNNTENVNYVKHFISDCEKKNKYTPDNCKSNYNDEEVILFNKCGLPNYQHETCDEKYRNVDNPYLNWTQDNVCNANSMSLIVGPNRKEHSCENIFNNNTKRKILSCDKLWDYYMNTPPDFSKNPLLT
mgnify:FL=1|tara:strand:- start:732 stop:1559 length:828 start_codon:yes stop_codon:yes gene_type:complete